MKKATTPITVPDPVSYQQLRRSHAETLHDMSSMIHHPRSLARPQPHWRPPSLALPGDSPMTEARVAISRHRLGPRAVARVKGFGGGKGSTSTPVYLITARFSNPYGYPLSPARAEAWVRALIAEEDITSVHDITDPRATGAHTFVWLVDAAYRPVESPSAMFAGLAAAA